MLLKCSSALELQGLAGIE